MAAIITSNFRLNNAKSFLADIADRSVYMFIGRSEKWLNSSGVQDDTAITTPRDRQSDIVDAWQKMIAMKKINLSDSSSAVPRYSWISGQTYAEYDDQDDTLSSKRFYVITEDFNVYKCLKAGSGPSVVKPTGQALSLDPRPAAQGGDEETDGYLWKFMYTLTGNDVTRFLTSTFLPVRTLTADDGTIQWNVQQAAITGAIYRIKVTSGGAGYTSTPTVTIDGNGAGAVATAVVSGGVVTSIYLTSIGAGYDYAKVTITGGGATTAATARAIVAPGNGHGFDPVAELNAVYTLMNVRLIGADGTGDFPVDNDFRQIGLIVDPYDYGTTTVSTATTKAVSRAIEYSGLTGGTFIADDVIVQASTGATAVIDSIDAANNIIRFHQNEQTGYKAFTVGGTITAGAVSASIAALNTPEVDLFSGKILYLENRAPVSRATDQTEDIKLVVEF
jgi:hypothetical protein